MKKIVLILTLCVVTCLISGCKTKQEMVMPTTVPTVQYTTEDMTVEKESDVEKETNTMKTESETIESELEENSAETDFPTTNPVETKSPKENNLVQNSETQEIRSDWSGETPED